MGCPLSKSLDEGDRKINQRIEKSLRAAKRENEFLIKLLLLGAGESGKSTFAKQMKILFMEGYNQKELVFHKDIIHSNAIGGIRMIIQEAKKRSVEFEEATQSSVSLLMDEDVAYQLTIDASLRDAIKVVWADKASKKLYRRRGEFQLVESVAYFLDSIDRICEESYVPSVEDVLQSRARTIGVKEVTFTSDHHQWKLVDVGGQRNERKKWIHCFDEVTALIFFADSSAYNMTLLEDSRVNRLLEALALFEEICNCKYFLSTPLILFLNKSDLLKKKLQKVDIADFFDDFKGGKDFDKAVEWLSAKFTSLNRNPDKFVFTYCTCATDTDNIKFTFEAVQELVLFETLESNDLI